MVKLLQLLLTYKFRTTKPAQKNGGFTLIELLVGIILAFLVIIPLLGFMVNLLRTDRQEQAKANSEQELQAAADYIARDVEQAVYIYDGYGLNKIKTYLPPHPDATNSVPVLVFWKRQILPKIIPVGSSTACQNQTDTCDDTFVYSLVVYYLTNSDANCASSPWSCTARISRVQLRDAVKDKDGNPLAIDPSDRRAASPGFVLFNPKLVPTSEEDSMNAWPGTTPPTYNANTPPPEVLIDYIDKSPFDATTQGCPPITRTKLPTDNGQPLQNPYTFSQVPVTPATAGFSACVGVDNTSAQIFLRGNSLARIQPKAPNPPGYSNTPSASTYFPTVRIQVQGRGVFKINQKS
jgi:type II secretory pathway pseudopilin PulG